MAVFIGDSKNTTAVRCGLKINWVAKKLVTPLKEQYPTTKFVLRHVVGIDTTSDLSVASHRNTWFKRPSVGWASSKLCREAE